MKLKRRLQNWLNIEKQKDWGQELEAATEKYRKEATVEFERIISQMKPVACINCKKLLIEGKDAVYTNFKGQKFCSHSCIDKWQDKLEKKQKKGQK